MPSPTEDLRLVASKRLLLRILDISDRLKLEYAELKDTYESASRLYERFSDGSLDGERKKAFDLQINNSFQLYLNFVANHLRLLNRLRNAEQTIWENGNDGLPQAFENLYGSYVNFDEKFRLFKKVLMREATYFLFPGN